MLYRRIPSCISTLTIHGGITRNRAGQPVAYRVSAHTNTSPSW